MDIQELKREDVRSFDSQQDHFRLDIEHESVS